MQDPGHLGGFSVGSWASRSAWSASAATTAWRAGSGTDRGRLVPAAGCALRWPCWPTASVRRKSWLPPGHGQGGRGEAALWGPCGAPARHRPRRARRPVRGARRARRPVRSVCRITPGDRRHAGGTASAGRVGAGVFKTSTQGRPRGPPTGVVLQLGSWPAHRHFAAPSALLAVVSGSRTRCEPSDPSPRPGAAPLRGPGGLGRASRPAQADYDLPTIILNICSDRY